MRGIPLLTSGTEDLEKYFEVNYKFTLRGLIATVIIIAITVFVWIVINKMAKNIREKIKPDDRRGFLVLRITVNVMRVVLAIIALAIILQSNGLDLDIISLTLAGGTVVIGLGLQDALKDFIAGVLIFINHAYDERDVVEYDGSLYEVMKMTILSTTMRELATSDIRTVSNRNIQDIKKVTGYTEVKIGLSYETDPEQIDRAFESICENIGKMEGVGSVVYKGPVSYGENMIDYVVSFNAEDIKTKLVKKRLAFQIAKKGLEEAGVAVPFNCYFKFDMKP